ncbi:MAG TPA: hypothetical protein VE980_13265, partial [Pyrinomonadaceae bacterium]|nr:hypothetical protein [Pyrinomonadaceae bacterium]
MLPRHRFLLFLLFLALFGPQALLPPSRSQGVSHAVLSTPLAALAVPQGSSYTYRRTITIDHTKVPNTDQT